MKIEKWRIKFNTSKQYYEAYPPQTELPTPVKFYDLSLAFEFIEYKLEVQAKNLRAALIEVIPADQIWGQAYKDIGLPLTDALVLMLQCSTDGPDSQADEYPELVNYNTL